MPAPLVVDEKHLCRTLAKSGSLIVSRTCCGRPCQHPDARRCGPEKTAKRFRNELTSDDAREAPARMCSPSRAAAFSASVLFASGIYTPFFLIFLARLEGSRPGSDQRNLRAADRRPHPAHAVHGRARRPPSEPSARPAPLYAAQLAAVSFQRADSSSRASGSSFVLRNGGAGLLGPPSARSPTPAPGPVFGGCVSTASTMRRRGSGVPSASRSAVSWPLPPRNASPATA